MHQAMSKTHFDKILVVDDTTANLQLLTKVLTEQGYTVYPASEGELALEFVRSVLPDLILLDIRMPGMDGYEVCRRLKAEERTRAIPIIFISILEDEADKVQGFQAGAVDYITKPFQPEEVLARIRTHLRLRELTDHLEHTVAARTEALQAANAQLQIELAERLRAEEALKRERLLLANIMETSPIGITSVDRHGQITFANTQAVTILGLTKDEITQRTYNAPAWRITDFAGDPFPDEHLPFRQVLTTRQPVYDVQHAIVWPDGRRVFLSINAAPILDESGHIERVVCALQDITERKQAEAALHESEQRYRLVFEHSPVSIWEEDFSGVKTLLDDLKKEGVADIETYFAQHPETVRQCARLVKIVNVNQAALALHTAATKEELLAGLVNTFTLKSFETFRQELISLWHGKTEMIGDAVVKTLTGDPRNVTVYFSVCPGYEDTLSKVLVSLIDMTARKRAEAEVRSLKNYLANIIDSMPSILVGIDRHERVTQWNQQAEDMTGISAAAAVGQPIAALLPDFSSWIRAMRSDIEQQRHAAREHLLIEQADDRRFYDLMLYPLIANGVEGAVIRIEDVTERTRIQELLMRTEKMISLGGLAAGMAHEINNPLHIITQAAQNIERRISPDRPANRQAAESLGLNLEQMQVYLAQRQILEFLGSIRTAASRAARIVANMLQFSRRTGTTRQPASLAGILDQAVELAASDYDLKKKYDFRSIEIIRDYAPEMPDIPVVAVEIEQVLLNLLKNAAQAMIVNPPDRSPRITLRLRRNKRYAVIEVEDNGPGMDETIRRRVFEPFFTTREPGIGTGLGLSVSYMIITQNHKGLLEVASTPGNGACFTVRLPLTNQARERTS